VFTGSSARAKEIRKEHPEIWDVIEKSKPPFLEEEMEMLEETCNVRPEPKPKDVYVTTRGGYRVTWCVDITQKEERNRVIEGLGLPKDKHRREE